MPVKRYNGSSWDTVAGDGQQGATGASGNTTVNSKGDLLTFDTAAARLPVGTNGQTLVADSTASTGLRWQDTYIAGKNKVINGDFGIWQRGTTFASSSTVYVFTADRWEIVRNGYATGMTVTRQTAGLEGFRYCARIQRDSGNTSTSNLQFMTSLETSEVLPLINKTITISFYARKSSTASSNSLVAQIIAGTGTDQAQKNYTGGTVAFQQTFTLTDSWQRFSFSGTVSSTYTEFSPWLGYTPTGTAGAADYYEITGVQIEAGSVATPFTTATGTLAGELVACQRYFQSYNNGGSTYVMPVMFSYADGSYFGGSVAEAAMLLPVQMRTAPTLTVTGTWAAYAFANHGSTGTLSIENSNARNIGIRFDKSSGGWTSSVGYANTSSGYFNLSAEL